MFDLTSLIAVLSAVLGIALVAAFARVMVRARVPLPSVMLMAGFFLIYSLERFEDRTHPSYHSEGLDIAMAAVMVVLLAYLLLFASRTMMMMAERAASADERRREYERALRDYEELVRHRVANPLTVITSGVDLLAAKMPEACGDTQLAPVLASISAAAQQLRDVSLDPSHLRPEEASLRPMPDVV